MHKIPPGGFKIFSSMLRQLGFKSLLNVKEKRKETGHYHDFHKFLPPGNQAPGFTLKNMDGTEVNLSDFQGKYVVLEFGAYT